MSKETDREDMNRNLVKMTSDEFATGFNKVARRSYQGLLNRETALMALIVLSVIGFSIYRHFFG